MVVFVCECLFANVCECMSVSVCECIFELGFTCAFLFVFSCKEAGDGSGAGTERNKGKVLVAVTHAQIVLVPLHVRRSRV